MLSIGYLTKAQAEELGLKIQTRAVGPDSLGVEIRFWKEGKFKMFGEAVPFTWMEFRIGDGETSRDTTALREDRVPTGIPALGVRLLERCSRRRACGWFNLSAGHLGSSD